MSEELSQELARKMKTTAWGIVHKDGTLCVALIRRTRKEAMQAQCDMFPNMSRDMFKLLGFRLRKVNISYCFNGAGKASK